MKPVTGDLMSTCLITTARVLAKALYYYLDHDKILYRPPFGDSGLMTANDRKDLPSELNLVFEYIVDDCDVLKDELNGVDYFVSSSKTKDYDITCAMIVLDDESEILIANCYDLDEMYYDTMGDHFGLYVVNKQYLLNYTDGFYKKFSDFFKLNYNWGFNKRNFRVGKVYLKLVELLISYIELIIQSYFYGKDYTTFKLIDKYMEGRGFIEDIKSLIMAFNYGNISYEELTEFRKYQDNLSDQRHIDLLEKYAKQQCEKTGDIFYGPNMSSMWEKESGEDGQVQSDEQEQRDMAHPSDEV